MILDKLENGACYAALHPLVGQWFDRLREQGAGNFSLGRTELAGADFFVTRSTDTLVSAADRLLEVHRDYIDIHIPLNAVERIGWAPAAGLRLPAAPYDTERDIRFYRDRTDCIVPVRPGEFLLLYPGEAHAPLIGTGSVEKLIVKIRWR